MMFDGDVLGPTLPVPSLLLGSSKKGTWSAGHHFAGDLDEPLMEAPRVFDLPVSSLGEVEVGVRTGMICIAVAPSVTGWKNMCL